jgi:surface antigen
MRVPKTFARLGGIAVLVAVFIPASAQAQNVFGRLLAELSAADRLAMERARNEVLAKTERGAVSMWKDDKTGHSGEARIGRTYERNGLMCAEVDHVLKLPRESHYAIPFCRDASGTWRAAF